MKHYAILSVIVCINITTVQSHICEFPYLTLTKTVKNVCIDALTTTWPEPETKDLGRTQF